LSTTNFRKVDHNLNGLVESIRLGSLALPDIQRPFVWPNVKVRNLFDSMIRGFPVGYLLFWKNAVPDGHKQIGADQKQQIPDLLIVDGQQRLTSLYAVLTGTPVIREDYKQERIRIAFRPRDRAFEVASAATGKDPEFVQDISEIWAGAPYQFIGKFIERLRSRREVSSDEEAEIAAALDALYDLHNYPFTVLELESTVSEEDVAEVFVRINAEGTTLDQADFILTLMSVFWDKGRRQLEDFARQSREQGTGPFNHFIHPKPDQMLRPIVALAFRRAALRHVYSILRGKDLETGEFSTEHREAQFVEMEKAQDFALNHQNWQEYLKCVMQAGYRSGDMISSDVGLLYGYCWFLIGRRDFGVDLATLRGVIARWFFMTALTGRYTGSYESSMERDLARLRDIDAGDSAGFVRVLDTIIEETFTSDYWRISLPGQLETAAARTPYRFAYWAALNLLGAKVLFSKLKVSELLDPTLTGNKTALEAHHLFPKAYLARLGMKDSRTVNQLANLALLEWPDNLKISDQSPSDYWPEMAAGMDAPELAEMAYWHALPQNWDRLEYKEFLAARRKLMADVVRDAFATLRASRDLEAEQQERDLLSLASESRAKNALELIARGEDLFVEFKESARWSHIQGDKEKASELEILRSLAGFMNAKGGTLLVGVRDDGEPVGLARDFKSIQKRPDKDGWANWLTGVLRQRLGVAAFVGVVMSFVDIDGLTICRFDAEPSAKPVFVDERRFFVRVNNATQEVHGAELLEYLERRGDAGAISRPAAPAPAPTPAPVPTTNAPDGSGFHDLTESSEKDEGRRMWSDDEIRTWASSHFVKRTVGALEEWIEKEGGPAANLTLVPRKGRNLYLGKQHTLFYYYGLEHIHVRLIQPTASDVGLLRSIGTPNVKAKWVSVNVLDDDGLDKMKQILQERFAAAG